MVEALQQFSMPNVTQMIVVVIVLWAIWPIACGLLGASRGQAFQGAMHGLLWGPLGLPIVLLSKKKYACPTCGAKTLTRPPETARPAAVAPPPQLVSPFARPAAPSLTEKPRPVGAVTPSIRGKAASTPAWEADEDEAEKLRAWVNSD